MGGMKEAKPRKNVLGSKSCAASAMRKALLIGGVGYQLYRGGCWLGGWEFLIYICL